MKRIGMSRVMLDAEVLERICNQAKSSCGREDARFSRNGPCRSCSKTMHLLC
jgi:hypothetical protein